MIFKHCWISGDFYLLFVRISTIYRIKELHQLHKQNSILELSRDAMALQL